MPEQIPRAGASFLASLPRFSFSEILFEIARRFIDDEISRNVLQDIVEDAFDFGVPLVPLVATERSPSPTFVLELFHGPTLSFKDFGARFFGPQHRSFCKKFR